MKILLNTIDKLRLFSTLAILFDGNLTLKSGRYILDAKSVLAIFSLNILNPIELEIECKDDVKREDFINDLKALNLIFEEV